MRVLFHPANPGFPPNFSKLLGKSSLPLQATGSLSGARRQVNATSPNVGNIVHNEAVAKTFDIDLTYSCMASIERLFKFEARGNIKSFQNILRANFDAVVFSFANMIARPVQGKEAAQAAQMERLTEITDAINVPLYVFGMGMQDPLTHTEDIQPELLQFLKKINQKAQIFGVRGRNTETFLKSIGCNEAIALGCPSLYVYPDNIFSIKPLLKTLSLDIITAGYLDRKHLLGYQPERFEALQKIARTYQTSYVFQNDLYTLHELENLDGLYNDADGLCDPKILHPYFGSFGYEVAINDFRFFRDPRAWRQFASSKDCFIGDRFHGGVTSLQSGRPALFLMHDLRVQELTDHFALPNITIEKLLDDDLHAIVENAFGTQKTQEMHETYSDRLNQYLSLTARRGLSAINKPKCKRNLKTDLYKIESDQKFASKNVEQALKLYNEHGASEDLAEVVLSAMIKSSEDESVVLSFLSSVLEKCNAPSSLSESYIFRIGRMLVRDRYYKSAVLLLDNWNPNSSDVWSERTITIKIQALAAIKKFQAAERILEIGIESNLLSDSARKRLSKRLSAT